MKRPAVAYTNLFSEVLKAHADPLKAPAMAAYLKDQFSFLGIMTPLRRQLIKEFLKENPPEAHLLEGIIKHLWQRPEREFQYAAMEIMLFAKKQWQKSIIELIEWCIIHKSWWDTVDVLAGHCTGIYFEKFPARKVAITTIWNNSDNIWLQRGSLLFQLTYKSKTDWPLLQQYILGCLPSKEFFIQKAVGWSLRQYARVAQDAVRDFVYENDLPPLSKREALKHL